jgi:alpha-methylacyl-CoA racemase
MLADFGANVLRVDKPSTTSMPSPDLLVRGKSSILIDLKNSSGRELLLEMAAHADVVIDPFRPGVLERLGLGPDVLLKLNPRLIVARLTGYRRDGKYAKMAGHDINYLAISGVLAMLGPADQIGPDGRPLPPSPPGNILGDFAGGGLMCVVGILLALASRHQTGKGQVVEANMVDGVSYISTAPRQNQKIPGQWDRPRGKNLVDGGCPYYGVYECKDDGKYMAVAGLEPQFFAALAKGLGISSADWGGLNREDRRAWPEMKEVLQRRFRSKTRKEWEEIFDGTDSCCTPVLTHAELEANGEEQRPGVHLSQTPGKKIGNPEPIITLEKGSGGKQFLSEWLGWDKGQQYVVENGQVVSAKAQSKL